MILVFYFTNNICLPSPIKSNCWLQWTLTIPLVFTTVLRWRHTLISRSEPSGQTGSTHPMLTRGKWLRRPAHPTPRSTPRFGIDTLVQQYYVCGYIMGFPSTFTLCPLHWRPCRACRPLQLKNLQITMSVFIWSNHSVFCCLFTFFYILINFGD